MHALEFRELPGMGALVNNASDNGEQKARGYELKKGEYVEVDKEELETVHEIGPKLAETVVAALHRTSEVKDESGGRVTGDRVND